MRVGPRDLQAVGQQHCSSLTDGEPAAKTGGLDGSAAGKNVASSMGYDDRVQV